MNGSKTKDFILVYLIDKAAMEQPFLLWPLHITLIPWFKATSVRAVITALRPVLDQLQPFKVRVGERELFGPRGIPVKKLLPSAELKELHNKLLKAISEDHGWEVAGRYTGDNYVPHVTQKAGKDAAEELSIDAVHIAEALPQGYRQVVAGLELGRE